MKKFYTFVLTVLSVCSFQFTIAQCDGIKGPNLLGAKGTFSSPFITINADAAGCTSSGLNTYSPTGNIGNALTGCTTPGNAIPCSDYTYTSANRGLGPEFTYTIIKNIGDINGGNCIKGDWKGTDHTGDGGYFMAVNGAPNNTFSNIFYQIKSIPVCIGATYEFSAWVLNILPSSSSAATPGSEPSISFKVNGTVIGNSGPIAYQSTAIWVKVGGSFVATTNTVDLQVINATAVAQGNDLGLDDISINVCQSQIAVTGPTASCSGSNVSVNFVVTDNSQTNTWYKWKISKDGGATFTDSTSGAQATFTGNSFTVPLDLGAVASSMNGYKYRLSVSTSAAGLANADCLYFNDYTLIVTDCGPLPVTLTSFNGRFSNGSSTLDWQTSQELNTDHFELFKSTDGKNFLSVTTIKSTGFSSLVKNYSYQDNSPNNGTYVYYRLKQVDINGKYTFSSIIKLALGLNTSVAVYPNPFINDFTVSFSAPKIATVTLKLQNSTGQLVFSKAIAVNKGNNSILINSLPSIKPGIYYMSVSNDELNFNSKLQKL
jgi:Secretion system C-terminal sorting domain